jgi:hypothetical protein
MDTTIGKPKIGLFLLAIAFIGLPAQSTAQRLASTQETLQAIGRRLSQTKSERWLTALASRGDLLLNALTPAERAALGRNYLRFRVEAPVIVYVAAAAKSVPFWLADLGFEPLELALQNEDTGWKLFRKTFGSGWVGLGVNGLDRSPVVHYAVFVQPEDQKRSPSSQAVPTLAPTSARAWKTTLARPGVSSAHDSHRPFASLPDELLGSLLIQPAHSDRHATLLATGRVWKTHVIATARPDQITISYGPDPARELVWCWTTSPAVNSAALRIAPVDLQTMGELKLNQAASAAPRSGIRLFPGEATPLVVPNVLNDPVVLRHRVAVDALEPDTTYLYSLGDGSPGGWAPWRAVRTGPDRSRDLQFLYLGDAQTGLEHWGELLHAACRRHPDANFIVLAGDLVDRGNERTNWDHFFLWAADVFDRLPVMPCVGNHEYLDVGPRLYRAFFELPQSGPAGIDPELVYRFECGDAFFAMLDSTLAVSDSNQARRQADWLDSELASTRATWRFVIFHHPVYPSHPWRDTPNLREFWVPVFDRHHIDLVLQGHDHAYLRTYPMSGHHRVESASAGTTYVVAVSGDKFVEQAHRDYIEVGYTNLATYQTVEIQNRSRRLIYRAWNEAGQIVDELRIEKPGEMRVTSSRDRGAGVRAAKNGDRHAGKVTLAFPSDR